MFVISMKTTRPRVTAYVAVGAALWITVLSIAGQQDARRVSAVANGGDDGMRVSYLQELGYEVDPTPVAVQEVLIPADSDETFAAYNALQTAAGHDLTPYCGERVKRWSYTVKNYPQADRVQAHLYVYNNKIIGGDVSSTVQGGFSHGLTPPTGERNGQTG